MLLHCKLAAADKSEISRPSKYKNNGRVFWVQSELAALTDKIREECEDLAAEYYWSDGKLVLINEMVIKIISAS